MHSLFDVALVWRQEERRGELELGDTIGGHAQTTSFDICAHLCTSALCTLPALAPDFIYEQRAVQRNVPYMLPIHQQQEAERHAHVIISEDARRWMYTISTAAAGEGGDGGRDGLGWQWRAKGSSECWPVDRCYLLPFL